MLLVLAATALVALALLSDLIIPRLEDFWQRYRARRARPPRAGRGRARAVGAAERGVRGGAERDPEPCPDEIRMAAG